MQLVGVYCIHPIDNGTLLKRNVYNEHGRHLVDFPFFDGHEQISNRPAVIVITFHELPIAQIIPYFFSGQSQTKPL